MNGIVDRLRVIYDLDDSRYTQGINRMRTAGDRFAREAVGMGGRAENAFTGMGRSALAAAAGVASLGVALNRIRTATDGYKTITNQLRSIGEESDSAVDKLLAVAIRSRAPIEDLATSVARIQKATGDGFEVTLRRAETLNKILAVGGATTAEVSSVVTQLSQALSAGALMGDEFASLREAAPVELMDALAAAAGTTRDKLKELSSEGQITTEVMTRALDSLAESADRSFGRTAQTTGQAMTNINSALTTFIGRVDEGTGASETLISAMNDLSGWLVENADEAVEMGQSLGAMFDTANGKVGEFLAELDAMADMLREALGTQPMDDFGEAIDRVIGFIADLNGAIEGAAAVAQDALLSIADNIAEGIAAAINTVIGAVQAMVNGVLAGVRAVAGAIDTLTAGAAAANNMIPEFMRPDGLRAEGTNLAGAIKDVDFGGVELGPKSSSGKPLSEVYKDARDKGAARVVDAIDRANNTYGGNLAGRQIAGQTPLQLGMPPVVVVDETGGVSNFVAPSGGGGGGSGKKGRGGGKGRKGKAEDPFFEDIETDILGLERRLELMGKTTEEAARMQARWEMLDEAKRRGIPVDERLNEQIDAQAGKFAQLTGELERAEIAQKQFEEAVDGIADAFAGAILAGESLREGLAQVFKQIASDILKSGISEALGIVFNPRGGGTSVLGNIFGGLFKGFRAGGGSVSGGSAYGVGENGPELFVPHVSGTILNQQQIARAGLGEGPKIIINNNAPGVQVQTEYATKDEVRLMVTQGVAGASRMQQDRQYLRNGR